MNGRGLVPVIQEARRLIDEDAVSPVTRLSELAHGLKPGRFDLGDRRLWYPECQEHGVENLMQMTTANIRAAAAPMKQLQRDAMRLTGRRQDLLGVIEL